MTKISLLADAATLDGTELTPVIQAGAAKKTSLSQLMLSAGAVALATVSLSAMAIAQTATTYVDALSTGDYSLVYESVGTTNQATLASNVGVVQVGLVNGTHIQTGDVIKAQRRLWACATGTVTVQAKYWKRNVATATTAGTINAAAAVAQDTLLATFTTTPAALGITVGTANPVQTNPWVLASPITVEAGYDLIVEWRNLDAGGATLNCGFMYYATAAGTQRRAGFQALTATPTVFTNLTTTRTPDIALLKAKQKTQLPATTATNRALLDRRDAQVLAAANKRNLDNLYLNAKMFPLTLAVPASNWGDSLTQDVIGTGEPGTGWKATDVMAAVVSGTVNNYGINGQTMAQITARVLAASGTDLAGFNQVKGCTNDLNTAGMLAPVLANFASCAAAFTNPNFLMIGGWHGGTAPGVITARRAFDVRSALKATYGAKALDMQAAFARYGAESSDWLSARRGAVPPDLTQDGVHQTRGGGLVKGYVEAAALVARAGGAPFVHDDIFGIKAGDAAGAAVGTVRALGAVNNFHLFGGNDDAAIQVNRLTGAITKTGNPIVQPYREVFVEGENNKGAGRNGRCIIVQQMDGTSPQSAVTVTGNGASFLNIRSDFAPVDGTEMTVVACLRLGYRAGGFIASAAGAAFLDQVGWGIRFTARNAAGASVGSVTVTAQNPSDWNFYFFTIKTDGAICAGVVNEGTAITAVPTASAVVAGSTMTTFFTNAADTIPWAGDLKMLAIYGAYYDVTNAAVRTNWYDSATKLPKDIGATGTAGGAFAQPQHYLKGMAGDFLLGVNGGSSGTLQAMVPLGRAHVGFLDAAA